jgi:uncharacterized membrane protein YdbT with pleckstrin-like domain
MIAYQGSSGGVDSEYLCSSEGQSGKRPKIDGMGYREGVTFPDRLLGEGEHVVIHTRQHWRALIWPGFFFVVLAGMAGFAGAWVVEPLARLGIVAAFLILSAYFVLKPVLRWLSTHLVITNQRVMLRVGILATAGRDMALSRITDVSFAHTLTERFFGCGTLVLESAGERGEVILHNIPNVEGIQNTLSRLVEQDAIRRTQRPDGTASPSDGVTT